MTIGICDDQKITLDYLSKLVKDDSKEHSVYCFESGIELLDTVEKGKQFDLVFLDIDFCDEMDGMKVAGELKKAQIEVGTAPGSLTINRTSLSNADITAFLALCRVISWQESVV